MSPGLFVKTRNKHILLISYFFPPYNPTEHRHALAIAQAVIRNGWDLDVIAPWAPNTHSDGSNHPWESAFKGPGTLSVHRTPARFCEVNPKLAGRIAGLATRLDRFCGGRVSSLLTFPDQFVSWILFVLPRALGILWKKKTAVVITSSFPYSAQVAGLVLHFLTRRPWIVDTRDGWAVDEREQFATMEPSPHRRRWHRKLMNAVVRRARQYWSLTPDICDATAKAFPAEPQEKFTAIMQGFETVAFEARQSARTAIKGAGLLLGYAGNFRPGLTPVEPLVESLIILKNTKPEIYRSILIRVWGYHLPMYYSQLMTLLTHHGLLDRFEYLHSVPEIQLINNLHDCDALLLTNGTSEWSRKRLSGKLFSYLSAKRPILAVCDPSSAIGRSVKETRTGVVVSPDDSTGLCRVLADWSRLRSEADGIPYSPNAAALRTFSLDDGVMPLVARKIDEAAGFEPGNKRGA